MIWPDHTLDTPAEDAPGGAKLEAFVEHLRKSISPERRETYTLRHFVRAVRGRFGLKAPISRSAVKRLLADLGIYWECHSGRVLAEPTLLYSKVASRWEVYTNPEGSLGWTRDVLHEVFEIVFWRCFHGIPWWRSVAERWRCQCPHKKGDEFAFSLLLPCGEYQKQAHCSRHNLWALAQRFGVTKNLAFRATTQFIQHPFPSFHMALSLDVARRQLTLMELMLGETEEAGGATVRQQAFKPAKAALVEKFRSARDAQEAQSWAAVEQLRGRFSRGEELVFSRGDVVYLNAGAGESPHREVCCIAGMATSAPVSVIVRRASGSQRLAYVQVVPVGEEELFLPLEAATGDNDWARDVNGGYDWDAWDTWEMGLVIPPLL